MPEEEPIHGGPIGPLDWLKAIPFEPDASKPQPADLRKGFDALAEPVRQHLRDDPLSGHVLKWPSVVPRGASWP
jgi:hypothetical protein